MNETRTAHQDREIHCKHSGDLTGEWDRSRLRQVVSNLLGNALQHSGAHAPVTVTAWGEANDVTLTVHNGGLPIPREALGLIYEPLVRGPQTDRRPGSLGLGLHIAKAIVLSHRGTIDVNSTETEGTTFTFTLPRRQPTK